MAVPSSFDPYQTNFLLETGDTMSLKIDHILTEPDAAIIGYDLINAPGTQYYIVIHFGGSTFNAVFVEVKNGTIAQ